MLHITAIPSKKEPDFINYIIYIVIANLNTIFEGDTLESDFSFTDIHCCSIEFLVTLQSTFFETQHFHHHCSSQQSQGFNIYLTDSPPTYSARGYFLSSALFSPFSPFKSSQLVPFTSWTTYSVLILYLSR